MNEVQGIINAVTSSYNDGMITESEALATIVSAVAQIWDSLREKDAREFREMEAREEHKRFWNL